MRLTQGTTVNYQLFYAVMSLGWYTWWSWLLNDIAHKMHI